MLFRSKEDAVKVTVTKAAKEAGTITIKDFQLTVDRTVAQGAYDVNVIDFKNFAGEAKLENFFVVGTPNAEDLASNGLRKGTASFVIGEAAYTVNGTVKAMDAASYIKDPGYTMVPMRYVAEAFGVKESDVLFNSGVVTIFAGSRTIQLTNNSDVATVNGVQIKMATKVEIKDGRTYAPIGEVAQLLGINKGWNNETKVASFTNN